MQTGPVCARARLLGHADGNHNGQHERDVVGHLEHDRRERHGHACHTAEEPGGANESIQPRVDGRAAGVQELAHKPPEGAACEVKPRVKAVRGQLLGAASRMRTQPGAASSGGSGGRGSPQRRRQQQPARAAMRRARPAGLSCLNHEQKPDLPPTVGPCTRTRLPSSDTITTVPVSPGCRQTERCCCPLSPCCTSDPSSLSRALSP